MQHLPKRGIDAIVNLPRTIKVPDQKKIFRQLEKIQPKDNISQELQKSFAQTHQILKNQFYCYEKPQQYQFIFPESKFEEVQQGHYNSISYEQRMTVEEQDTFKDRLSQEQLNQISQSAQFEVKSNLPFITLPYRWKINDRLFRGKDNITLIWKKGLANIYDLLCDGVYSITTRIPNQIMQLIQIPKRAFSVIFGEKKHQTIYKPDYNLLVTQDFFQYIVETQFNLNPQGWGKPFWDFLFVRYFSRSQQNITYLGKTDDEYQKQLEQIKNLKKQQQQDLVIRAQKRNQFTKIDNDFLLVWGRQRKKIVRQIQQDFNLQQNQAGPKQQINDNYRKDKIQLKVQQKKFTMYLQHAERGLKQKRYQDDVITAIICLMKLFQTILVKKNRLNKEIEQARQNIIKQIKKNYPIRSLSNIFYNKQFEKRYQIYNKNIKQYFYENLINDQQFKSVTTELQRRIYTKYLQFKKEQKNKISLKKKEIQQLVIPSRTFYSTYLVLPPYEVVKVQQRDYVTYTQIREKPMTIDTRSHFWKIRLYLMRMKSWTINCFIFLIGQALKGPLGFRCLFGKQDFEYDCWVNYQTGEPIPYTRKTVIGVFLQVVEGFKKSRNDFQALKDKGIFGKKFSRIFNLIQCYIFRLLFVGVIIVLILYPLAIILNVLLSIFLVVTVWFWTPIIMIVTYLFNIFIYQFQSNYIPFQCKLRLFPIPNVIFTIIKAVILINIYLLHFFIICPILAIVFLLMRLIQRIFRTFTDTIMYIFFKFFGRTPSNDSAIAWKISGPGMSKSYYMSLNADDVYVLTQGQLEKIYMAKFHQKMQLLIPQHLNHYQSVMAKFLKPYVDYCNPSEGHIQKNTQKLFNNFYKQYNKYMCRYPKRAYNVRFTAQEIQNYFENCEMIVRNFIRKNEMEGWIFNQYYILDGDYAELTHKIWVQLFQCGEEIFQPLQKIDTRFQLRDVNENYEQMSRQVQSIKRALESQVVLHKRIARVGGFRSGTATLDPQIFTLNKLAQYNEDNSLQAYSLLAKLNQSLDYIFVPALNMKQTIKNVYYKYNYLKETNNNLL